MDSDEVVRQEIKNNKNKCSGRNSRGVDLKLNEYNCKVFADETSNDQSDLSPVYLECESTEDEVNTEEDADDSTGSEEQQKDPKDVYMVVVSDEKTNSDAEFYCDLCNLTLNTVNEVDKHVTTHELDTCKKCKICYKIMYMNMYDIHMKLHKEAYKQRKIKNTTKCKTCGKCVRKTYLKFHMKMHGTEKDKTERLKQCTICNKRVSYNYFNGHMKRIHYKSEENTDVSIERAKICPICDRSIKSNAFDKHLASHGNHQKQYICDQCGRVFKHYSAFKTHLLIHVGDLKYKCQFCPYRGLHLGLLKSHVRTHTKDYLYECSTCSRKFLTKSNLSIHERRHTASNSIVCPECKRKFYSQRNLDKHFNMIHLGIRNEKCDICNKAFGHRDGLLSHQKKVHNKEKSTHMGRLPTYLKLDQSTYSNK